MINKKFMFPEPGNLLQYKQLYEMDKKSERKRDFPVRRGNRTLKQKESVRRKQEGILPLMKAAGVRNGAE
jgi:hypothetical protein